MNVRACPYIRHRRSVIPAKAGIQWARLCQSMIWGQRSAHPGFVFSMRPLVREHVNSGLLCHLETIGCDLGDTKSVAHSASRRAGPGGPRNYKGKGRVGPMSNKANQPGTWPNQIIRIPTAKMRCGILLPAYYRIRTGGIETSKAGLSTVVPLDSRFRGNDGGRGAGYGNTP